MLTAKITQNELAPQVALRDMYAHTQDYLFELDIEEFFPTYNFFAEQALAIKKYKSVQLPDFVSEAEQYARTKPLLPEDPPWLKDLPDNYIKRGPINSLQRAQFLSLNGLSELTMKELLEWHAIGPTFALRFTLLMGHYDIPFATDGQGHP